MSRSCRDFLKIVPIWALLLLPTQLHGQGGQHERRITVTGHGRIEAKPDVFEITLLIQGHGTLAREALENFRNAKKKAVDAIAALKVPGLSIVSSGATLGSVGAANARLMNVAGGGVVVNQAISVPNRTGRGSEVIHETLTVHIANIDQMTEDQVQDLYAKLSEDLKKSKAIPAANFSVVFRLDNPTRAQTQAIEAAVTDAKSRAQRLAGLLGLKVGKVIHVQEHDSTSNSNIRTLSTHMPNRTGQTVLSAVEPKLTVSTSILVEFEINE